MGTARMVPERTLPMLGRLASGEGGMVDDTLTRYFLLLQHFRVDGTPVLSVYHDLACQDAFSISPVFLLKQLLGL